MGGVRIKAFFSVAAKVELDEKKKQADAIYEADVRSALDFYTKEQSTFMRFSRNSMKRRMNFTEK